MMRNFHVHVFGLAVLDTQVEGYVRTCAAVHDTCTFTVPVAVIYETKCSFCNIRYKLLFIQCDL